MISRRGILLGAAALGLILPANAAYLPFTQAMINALDFGVKGDGTTNDAAAIQAFINTASTRGAIGFFPGLTYICGNTGFAVPANSILFSAAGATFTRNLSPPSYLTVQTKTNVMFQLGNGARFYNGTITKTSVLGTSTTSNTIVGSGSVTWIVPTGLNILTGDFMRFWNTTTPKNYIEGTVSAYNSGTGSLTLTVSFSNGSGTITAWTLDWEGVYQTPISFANSTGCIIDGTTITGPWYEGFLFDGDNASGTTLKCTDNITRGCNAIGILNRAFDLYGNAWYNKCIGCHVDGSNGTTDYGWNLNAANNPSNQGQVLQENVIEGCTVISTSFQGFALGDTSVRNRIIGCSVNSVGNVAGVGFELVFANGNSPQYNVISGCTAQNCVGFGFQLIGTLYDTISGCQAIACGTGVGTTASGGVNTQECNIDIIATGNTTGVNIGTGTVNTLLTGRSANNTTQLTDSGTGTVHSGLLVV